MAVDVQYINISDVGYKLVQNFISSLYSFVIRKTVFVILVIIFFLFVLGRGFVTLVLTK